MKKTPYADAEPYKTKDGSSIKELMHPRVHGQSSGVKQQSFAEAQVPVGGKTRKHKHHSSEELYHITQGKGLMVLGDETFEVGVGDTVCIPPGTPHCIDNTGNEILIILCCCSPAYAHDDTELL